MQLLHQLVRPVDGTAIMALEQTNGKGQRDRKWYSEPGKNLTVSYILYPTFIPVHNQFCLSIAVALAVSDTIKTFISQQVCIKWPNDILVNSQKIAGVLIENIVSKGNIAASIVGIGINCNQQEFDPSLTTNPTSLLNITDTEIPVDVVFADLSSAIERRYLQLRANKTDIQSKEYISRLFRYNEAGKYRFGGEEIIATITGVSRTGHLQLTKNTGYLLEADLKEIEFLF